MRTAVAVLACFVSCVLCWLAVYDHENRHQRYWPAFCFCSLCFFALLALPPSFIRVFPDFPFFLGFLSFAHFFFWPLASCPLWVGVPTSVWLLSSRIMPCYKKIPGNIFVALLSGFFFFV